MATLHCKSATGVQRRDFAAQTGWRAPKVLQKLRIQSSPHGAFSHRRRIARPRARRHSRRHSGRVLPSTSTPSPRDLRRRQGGYGRGRRMAIESDRADILSGVRAGETIGGPIAMIDREPRLGRTGSTRCAIDADAAGRCAAAPVARRSPGRVPGTPTSPAWRSTAAATCATSSSAPARARPRRAWPPARSRGSCWRTAGVRHHQPRVRDRRSVACPRHRR